MKIAIIGSGYGGSCFPKDTEALYHFASTYGYDFKTLGAVVRANIHQREIMVDKIKHHIGDLKGKTIAILGLAFKQNTDDIRKSLSIDIINSYSKKKQTSNALTLWQWIIQKKFSPT